MQNNKINLLSNFVVLALISLLQVPLVLAQDEAKEDDSGFKYIEIKVLDPDGKPLADAAVEVSMDGIDFPLIADEEGIASLNVPSTVERSLMLGVRHDGFAAVGARWSKGDKVPDEFLIRLEKGATIGGIVHDEDGNPVEGVDVKISMSSSNTKAGELRPWFSGIVGTTDSEGRWHTETAPEKKIQLYFRLNHPDFIEDHGSSRQRPTWNQLKSMDYVFVIEKGIEIRGRVVDADDQPVVGAEVVAGLDRYNNSKEPVETDENGEYLLKNVKAGNIAISVVAKELAADMQKISASKESEPINFQLQPGNHIRFQITDPDGQPLEGVRISPEEWRGFRCLVRRDGSQETDSDGVWEWNGAPADEIQFNFYLSDYMSVRKKQYVPQEEAYEIQMGWPLVLSGKVVDAETGKPIDKFEIIEGGRWHGQQRVSWQMHRPGKGQAGKYQVKYTSDAEGYRIKIRAEGYRPVTSELVAIDAGEVTLDFELEAGTGPSGIVKTPTGEPADGAQASLVVVNQYLQISNGKLQDHSDAPQVTADAEGRFQLPFPEDDYYVVFVHDSGWKQLTAMQFGESEAVTLEPWSSIKGVFLQGQEPQAGERIYARGVRQHRQGQPNVYWSNSAQTEGDGSFVFERVRAGATTVSRNFSYGDTGNGARMGASTHSEYVELKPGKTGQVQLGGVGNTLRGQFVIPDDYEGEVVWAMGVVNFSEKPQNSALKNPLQALGKAIAQFGQKQKPAENLKPKKQPRRYATPIAEDGSFEIFDVVPGEYVMTVRILAPPTGNNYNWNPIANFNKSITVPEVAADSTDEPVDLGEHELSMVKPAEPVPAPATSSKAFTLTPTPVSGK